MPTILLWHSCSIYSFQQPSDSGLTSLLRGFFVVCLPTLVLAVRLHTLLLCRQKLPFSGSFTILPSKRTALFYGKRRILLPRYEKCALSPPIANYTRLLVPAISLLIGVMAYRLCRSQFGHSCSLGCCIISYNSSAFRYLAAAHCDVPLRSRRCRYVSPLAFRMQI